MKHQYMSSSWHGRTAPGRKSFEKRRLTLVGEKQNRCVILPATMGMVDESIERKENSWFVRTKETSDLIIRIGHNATFHLHMVPMLTRSGYLTTTTFQIRNQQHGTITVPALQIDNLPGGPDIFELVVKFCYGWKVDLTPTNIAPLYCTAHFLEMRDDLEKGNLISRTETFLSFIILTSWKDSFRVLKTCELISLCARELKIQTRCSEAIAWKVSLDIDDEAQWLFDYGTLTSFKIAENWWFEDVSALRIDHFVEVMTLLKKRKGAKPEVVGSCIAYWTAKWLSRIGYNLVQSENEMPNHHHHHHIKRVTIESLIGILPDEDNSVSCNFLLHLLKMGWMVDINSVLLGRLERRIAVMLEECQPCELLVRDYGSGSSSSSSSSTLYDVKIIARVVEGYSASISASSLKVARLVDGFLMMIAKDKNGLWPGDFQLVAESVPKNARYTNDTLYMAIDSYLKAHPDLTEEERKGVCRAMEYHKLSQAAREHAMRNVDRMPANLTAQFIMLEYGKMVKSVTESEMDNDRLEKQGGRDKKGVSVIKKEMGVVKEEVERLKREISKLQGCKVGIKRMMGMGIPSD